VDTGFSIQPRAKGKKLGEKIAAWPDMKTKMIIPPIALFTVGYGEKFEKNAGEGARGKCRAI